MTAGRSHLHGSESIYDLNPVLLFDRFPWADRQSVQGAVARIMSVGIPKWTFGGAYIFCSMPTRGGSGEVLYVGETRNFSQRLNQHLVGPGSSGNKHDALASVFSADPQAECVLALLVVQPTSLPVLDSPDGPVLESGIEKVAGEGLEALLLKAHINWRGCLPRLNSRADEAKAHHAHDGAYLWSLVRFLLDEDDANQDFVSILIRAEQTRAEKIFAESIASCPALPSL